MTFYSTIRILDRLSNYIKKDLEFLKHPEKILITCFPAKIKGKTEYLTGYRVQYNSTLGPTKGGIRYSPHVNLDEVKSLAFWMTIKCSLAGLPFGGGKGGVKVNAKELSAKELEYVTRSFTRSISEFIGPKRDIPAPDVYTNEQVMMWMRDEYEKIKGVKAPGVVTGKPLDKGGSLLRDVATSLGAFFIIKRTSKPTSVIVQGFGNAGMNIALMLHKEGYKMVGISDSRGGVYNDKGINVPELVEHKRKTGSVQDFKGFKNVSNNELLELNADILIPAAIENQITKDNANDIKVKKIYEIANGPVTDEADKLLKIPVYPDVLCNSGGVIVSYYEWVQNNSNEKWGEDKIKTSLKNKMLENLEKVVNESKVNNCSLRTAAYILAIKRLIKARES